MTALHSPISPEIQLRTPVQDAWGFLFRGVTEKANVGLEFSLRIPNEVENMSGVVIVPGLYGLKTTYGPFRDALADMLKRPVATYRHERIEKSVHAALQYRRLAHPAIIGAQSVVAMVDTVCELTGFDQTIVIGHSKGGPDAADGALRRTDKVTDVVFAGSGGLEEGQNIVRMARRMPGVIKREILPGVHDLTQQGGRQLASHAFLHAATNPWRLGGEILDISNRPMMHAELTQLGRAGVSLHSAHFENDGFFPLEHIAPSLPGYMDSLHVMADADHLAFQKQPFETAQFIARCLEPVVLASAA